MNETENTTYFPEDDIDAIMPVGYADGDDFFDPNSWTGNTEANSDAPVTDARDPETQEVQDSEEAPAIEQTEETPVAEESEKAPEETDTPATEPPAEAEAKPSNKRKVKYQFNHADVEEDIDLDTDLPELLQKARSLDRYKERVGQMQKRLDRYDATAKALGHESGDTFLDDIISTARKSERDELIAKGTAPALVDDYLGRKYAIPTREEEPAPTADTTAEAPAEAPAAEETKPGKRDFLTESRDLLKAYPDMIGKQMPQEVITDAVANNRPMLDAYRAYRERTEKAESDKALAAEKARADKAEKENRILKQNAASAEKAPVSGITKGGSTGQKAEDPFLKGFNEDW